MALLVRYTPPPAFTQLTWGGDVDANGGCDTETRSEYSIAVRTTLYSMVVVVFRDAFQALEPPFDIEYIAGTDAW